MSTRAIDRVLLLLKSSTGVKNVDITGGAPEMHPEFRRIVKTCRLLGHHVMNRCNLTILSEPDQVSTAQFLAAQNVEIFASLPCYSPENVDKQRGIGVFERSIEGIKMLNQVGYGTPGSNLRLNLVYNPIGADLPPDQTTLEAAYKERLFLDFGIHFNVLYTITNMPIARFKTSLKSSGHLDKYLELLLRNFNPNAVPNVMCRELVSIGWTGNLYDCDFNQMLELPIENANRTIWDIDTLNELFGDPISTDSHCFGCTAGSGSSCGGSLT